MRKSMWARSAAVAGAAAMAMAVSASPVSAQEPAPNPLEGSIQMDVLDSIITNSGELAANPWILSIYGGSIAFCLFNDCKDDNT